MVGILLLILLFYLLFLIFFNYFMMCYLCSHCFYLNFPGFSRCIISSTASCNDPSRPWNTSWSRKWNSQKSGQWEPYEICNHNGSTNLNDQSLILFVKTDSLFCFEFFQELTPLRLSGHQMSLSLLHPGKFWSNGSHL